MSHNNSEWEHLGRSIQDAIDRAVNSKDYQKLNQTIRQAVGRAVDLGSEAVRKAGSRRSDTQMPKNPPRYQPEPAPAPPPALYGKTGSLSALAVLKTAGGGLVSFLSLVYLSAAATGRLISGGGFFTPAMAAALVFLAGGLTLALMGAGTMGKLRRFKLYRRILGSKTYCSLQKLADGGGKSLRFVRRELRWMIQHGLFLEGHLDREETCLITSHETYQYFEQSRLQLEQHRQEAVQKADSARPPQVQEVLDRGNAYIAEIRRCNDIIPGTEISMKISRMETIVKKIFQRAEAHPEIIPDLQKLMDYYLPMTVKLLNAYADMDAQPIQGQTMAASKKEIEASLDTLNQAFEKLLDDAFRDTALDISGDISVLNTILAQEGLTEDEFTKIKRRHSAQTSNTGD